MEEDIKILEEKIKALNLHILNYKKSDCKTSFYETLLLERNALVNILKERQADKEHIKKLEGQVKMLDEAYSGAIKESKKYFEIVKDSIPKAKIKEIVDECIPVGKNIITGKEEYKPNANANSYLTQMILELLKDGGE